MIGFVFLPARIAIDFACEGRGTEVEGITQGFVVLQYKVTTKKWNAERYSDRIELQGF